jgi:hypothetical protein
VANEPVHVKDAIIKMFENEFASAEIVRIPENIFEDGEWAILEWKDPKEFRGCGFFKTKNDRLFFKEVIGINSFYKLYNIRFT